ncbi:MAG: hypothetical protein ACI9BW_001205 [Gammaproteobacteria bacterium]|jgi:hypothetical protein
MEFSFELHSVLAPRSGCWRYAYDCLVFLVVLLASFLLVKLSLR